MLCWSPHFVFLGLILVIFFAILVKLIITPLARAEHPYSQAAVESSVFNKYFLFLLFNIFLGSIVASGIFNILPQIAANPTNIVTLLAETLPRQVTFFISYVMVLALSGFGGSLLRIGSLVVPLIHRLLAKTRRQKRNIYAGREEILFSANTARHVLIFLLTTVYSTLNPLIIPFGCIYFGICYWAERYNTIYNYDRTYSEAAWFPSVITRCMVKQKEIEKKKERKETFQSLLFFRFASWFSSSLLRE